MKLKVAAKTDVGKLRDHNEDSFCVNIKNMLFIVADGMGGHAAGEVASNLLKDHIEEYIVTAKADGKSSIENNLQQAVGKANRHIHEMGLEDLSKKGMGTTATILFFTEEHYYIAQVGDSRAYLYRNGELKQITKDHSKVFQLFEHGLITREEMEGHPFSNIITRSIGNRPTVEADIYKDQANVGDRFLLCSDGLTGEVKDSAMEKVLKHNGDPQKCCDLLIEQALENGGKDNITIIIADVLDNDGTMRKTVPINKEDVDRLIKAHKKEQADKKKAEDLKNGITNRTPEEETRPQSRQNPDSESIDDEKSYKGFLVFVFGLMVLVILILAGYLYLFQPPKECPVTIESIPPGAEVYINGLQYGETPVIIKLKTGVHQISLLKNGFNKLSSSIVIKEGETTPMRKSLPLEELNDQR